MENPFLPKEKGMEYCTSSRAPIENLTSFDGGSRNLMVEDMFNNFSELLNNEAYAGWCNSPQGTDHISVSCGFSSFPCSAYVTLDACNFNEASENFNTPRSPFNYELFQQGGTSSLSENPNNAIDSATKQNNGSFQPSNGSGVTEPLIHRPIRCSIDERMLRALSLFKESSGGGILAQVWVPMKHGEDFILSTSEQPYLLDRTLAGYREVSRMYKFSAERKPGAFLGLPGRVFFSKVPEWTSDIGYYNKTEYLRLEHAVNHQVHGSIAIPIFNSEPEMSCCAVLELVTTKEKSNFDTEMEIVCQALKVCFALSICV